MKTEEADDPLALQDLKQSNRLLQSLFDNMISGFAYHKLLTDEKSEPIDYIFLEVNKAFERYTGLTRNDIIGKRVTEIHPEIRELDFDWIGTYGRVALTGNPVVFEQYFEPQDHWYRISAYCPQIGYFALTFENITERKKASDLLRENEVRYRELFERMPSGVAVYEVVGDGENFIIKDMNRNAESIEQVTAGEILGKPVTEIFPGVADFGLLEVLRRVLKTGNAEYLPASFYSDDRNSGSWRENWVYPLPSGDIVAVYNDVTKRKRTEEKLREALLRQSETAKAGDVGLWEWDLATDKVSYSPEWKKQIGFEAHEIGDDFKEWEHRVHPDDLHPTLKAVQRSISEGSQNHQTEFRFRHKDGSFRWILSRASVLQDESGRPVRMLGSHVDITDRKRSEEALIQSKERLTSLVENLIDALVVTDQSGTIQFLNASACRLFGRKRDRLQGSSLGFPVTLDEIFNIMTPWPNGEIRFAEARATRGHWDGRPAFILSIRDITEKKRALDEQKIMNERMQQMERIESIGTLAGGIAHDFNNMLSVIMGYSQEIHDRLHENDPLRESAKEILEAGRRSAELTSQLLAFSRRQMLQSEVLDLNVIVENMESMLRRLIGEDIDLTSTLDGTIGHVEADPGQIEQVIVNLAVNARDAMPDGGRLSIETAKTEMDEALARIHFGMTPGRYVMLSVTDNGCGMDEETRTKVFEPFFSTKAKDKGTGLGLSTVYGIVKQSGGYIWVYSEPDQGTAIKIYFPETDRVPSGRRSSAKPVSIDGNGETILVVEDERSLRKLCKSMLELLKYNVTVAANGGDALLLVEEGNLRPDLIITDVVMPEMSGKVLAERLKKSLPDLKILYMSGYTDDAIVHHGVLDSGTPFIQKPFSKSQLGKTIKSVLDGP